VLAPSPTPAVAQDHVSTHLNKFQLGLQFVIKQNYSFLLGKATFGTHCIPLTMISHDIFECFTRKRIGTEIQTFSKSAGLIDSILKP
jgi:hypothetical protein